MKRLRKLLIVALSLLTLACGTIGLVACNDTPNLPNSGLQSDFSDSGSSESPDSSSDTSDGGSTSGGDSSSDIEHSHEWNEGVITTPATCEKDGVKTYSCACGESYTETVKATGHSYDNGVITTPAACEKDGVKTYSCACGESYTETVKATGHSYDNGVITTPATCEKDGVKTYSCACGESYTEVVKATGHILNNIAGKEPTCEQIGWKAYATCEKCEYSTYEEIPATGHSYNNGVITNPATCEKDGVKTYSCACGESYTEVVKATGHSYDNGVITTPATCEKDGVKTYSCACGESYTETVKATGHAYGKWSVTTQPTCETQGEETRICANDNTHTEKKTVNALGHAYEEWVQSKAPTCGEVGQEKRVCSHDTTHVETRDIPKTDNHKINDDGICSACGKTIKHKLATPTNIQKLSDNTVIWDVVNNASEYLVHILPNDDYVDTTSTSINLVEYFAGNEQLAIYVQAVAEEESDYISSAWSLSYIFVIEGEATVLTQGVGSAVNLLTGSYTDFVDTTLIFDETLFSRLRLTEDTSVAGQDSTFTSSTSLSSYLSERTTKVSAKVNANGSAGFGTMKATAGYNFSLAESYEKKSQSETESVFLDLDTYIVDRKLSLTSYAVNGELSKILSESFLADAKLVNNGSMKPERFIALYGTHIVTAGIYGATFNAHYELIKERTEEEDTQNINTAMEIQAQLGDKLGGAIYDLNMGLSVGFAGNYFAKTSSSDCHVVNTVKTKGQGATAGIGTDIESFASSCDKWLESLTKDSYVLIDVPDNSLYFVWDFLGDEYAEAKNILNTYFYGECDKNYAEMKAKMGSIYTNSVIFDEDTGVLTVDMAGLQLMNQDEMDLSAFQHGWFADNVFTVYSEYGDKPIKKVVFKGGYYDTINGVPKETVFKDFSIYFNEYWDEDIVIEFDSFAYQASAGKVALDLSAVASENITIIVKDKVFITGGDGSASGASGFAGILTTKNLTILGDGGLTVVGGTCGKREARDNLDGSIGGKGGVAISANTLSIKESVVLFATGGKGGDGGNGDVAPHDGYNGYAGGKGGNGGIAISADSITIYSGTIEITGGIGGNGGNGGHCNPNGIGSKEKGGNGGQGGDGGLGISANTITIISGTVNIVGGDGGQGGSAGGVYKGQSGGTYGTVGQGGAGGISINEDCKYSGNFSKMDGNVGKKGD